MTVFADTSQRGAILDAIYTLATTPSQAGVTFAKAKKWELPLDSELQSASCFPFFCVTYPQPAGGAMDGGQLVGPFIPRQDQLAEPVTDYDIYAIYPFEAGNPLTYSTPLDTLCQLEHCFTVNWTLSGTVYQCEIGNPRVDRIRFPTSASAKWHMAAMMTIRAYEGLGVSYT